LIGDVMLEDRDLKSIPIETDCSVNSSAEGT